MPKKASAKPKVNLALKRELQDFQVRQLKRNFSDLYASKDYGQLCEFFAQDIYAVTSRSATAASSKFRVTSAMRSVNGSSTDSSACSTSTKCPTPWTISWW